MYTYSTYIPRKRENNAGIYQLPTQQELTGASDALPLVLLPALLDASVLGGGLRPPLPLVGAGVGDKGTQSREDDLPFLDK